jgi:hypothetical protein
MQATQCREDFSVEMGRRVQRTASHPAADGCATIVAEQEIDERRGIDDQLLSHRGRRAPPEQRPALRSRHHG